MRGGTTLRLEDADLLTGQARFLDDLPRPDAHAVFVRSTIPHGTLRAIDVEAAAALPGVLGVFTAGDLGLGRLRAHAMLDGTFDRPPLAADVVRFVGEPVAVVVATTRAVACDAAELVEIDITEQPWVADVDAALCAPAPFPGRADPIAFEHRLAGDDAVLRGAARVVELRSTNQRVATAPMEPDGAQAEPTPGDGVLVWASTQRVHHVRTAVAEALRLDPVRVTVRAPHVGGGFGGKFEPSPETIVVAALALRLGRSVRWVQTRRENLQTMPHGRAQRQHARLGLGPDGRFEALWAEVVNDAGAYPMVGAVIPMATMLLSPGPYRIGRVGGRGQAVCTNKAPLGAFRGAGRPEATAMLERLIDVAAAELGIDPVELRRRNLIRTAEHPFTSATGMTYDGGDYPALLQDAVARIGYAEERHEQAARRADARRPWRGIGVAMWMDCTPMNRPAEHASIDVQPDPDGPAGLRVLVRDGANDQGQAHRTTWALLINAATGVPVDAVRLGLGDTDHVPSGEGTGSARSTMLAGGAVAAAAAVVAEQARHLGAHLLEAAADDVVLGPGGAAVRGTPARAVTWATLARAATHPEQVPGALARRIAADRGCLPTGGLGAAVDFEQPGPTFPSGCHAAVVDVDRETGRVQLRRFVAVDDCGTVVNATVVEGQQHGGIAQGIAQALFEEMVYDADGNPLTSTFAEYAVPSAAELPGLDVTVRPTPSPVNALGVRGIGQAGAIGSTVAVQNAVVDALAHLGVRHIDLPLTPERVWRSIEAARRRAG